MDRVLRGASRLMIVAVIVTVIVSLTFYAVAGPLVIVSVTGHPGWYWLYSINALAFFYVIGGSAR